MSTIKIYPSVTWYWRDQSKRTDTETFAIGRTASGTNVYYAVAEFDVSAQLAGKRITSATYYVKSTGGGNSTNCLAGVYISKYSDLGTCVQAMTVPNGTNTIENANTNYVGFNCTSNAYVLQNSGTSYVLLGHTTSTNNTYKILHGSSASDSDKPYLEIVYDDGDVQYHDGTAWKKCEMYYCNDGATFTRVKPYYCNDGTTWEECGV